MINKETIVQLDLQVAQWLHAHAFEPMTSFMLGVSLLHTVAGIAVLAALFALYLRRRQAHYWLWVLLVAVPSGMLLNVLLKYVFQRSRPVFEHPLVTLTTSSFPSGHASSATLLYGVLVCYLVRQHRYKAVPACVLMVLLVATSRMYLGAHYLTDVLAAMAEGVIWLAICMTAISALQRRRASAKP